MTDAPVPTFYQLDDFTPFDSGNLIDFGTANPSDTTDPVQVNVWNNKDGASEVADMTNVECTIATLHGLMSGDTGPTGQENLYGQEVVEDTWIQVKKVGETSYNTIGGANTYSLGTIAGDIGGAKVETLLRAVLPLLAADGTTNFLYWITYDYV